MPDTLSLATLLTAGAALLVVLAALALVLRGVRAAGIGRATGRRLVVEEALALDGKRRLLLLSADGRRLLLLTGGPNDQVLGWLPREDGA